MPTAPLPTEWADLAPGDKRWVTRTFTTRGGRSFDVAVGVIRGAADGPVFANVAGQHGMEHAGPIVLREVYERVDPKSLRGTLLLCPCANPLALELNFEVYPERDEDELPAPGTADLDAGKFNWKNRDDLGADNMNRMWPDDIASPGASPGASPASEDSGYVDRVARWLWRAMIAPADFVIDHHCVRDTQKPYIFVEQPSVPWTPLLDLEGVWCTGPLKPEPTPYAYQRLCVQASRHGKVGICVEYAAQRTIRESDRAAGHAILDNVMRALDMTDGDPRITAPVWLIPGPYWEHLTTLEADRVGHIHWCDVDDYQPMKQGDPICHIHCLQTHARLQTIAAPGDGILLHRTPRAIARKGEWVCRFTTEATRLAEPGQPYAAPPLPGS